jgi:hypothetical protein
MVIRDKLVVDFLPQRAQGRHKEHKGFILCLVKILMSLVVRRSFFTTKCTREAQRSQRNYSVLGEEFSFLSG